MPEDIDHLDFEPEDGGEPSDAAEVAFLDQESAAFNDSAESFFRIYGFKHECRCAEDYSSGNLAEVTKCFLGLSTDALDALSQKNYENRVLKIMLTQVVQINNDLMDKMNENGLEDVLRKYMDEPAEIEASDEADLIGLTDEGESSDEPVDNGEFID